MDNYVIDTDIFSLFERKHPVVIARIGTVPPDQRFISAITVRERLDGWYGLLNRIKTDEQEAAVYDRLVSMVRICATMRILPYDVGAIARYKQLLKMRLNVRPMDLRLAAVALEQNAVLVTHNTRDFARVPGLRLEDGTEPENFS